MTTDCFRTQSNVLANVTGIGDRPCGSTSNGFSQCCRIGDQCLEDEICHFTRAGTDTSGYYVASCTDESQKDSTCLQTCKGNGEPDIVYSETDTLWHCCEVNADAGTTNCSDPTDLTFEAPAPANLAVYASTSASSSTSTSTSASASSVISSSSSSPLPSSSSASTTQSSPIANSVSSTPTSSSTLNSNSGISTGAKAGIGTGVALGAVCIVLLSIVIFVMRKRQRRQRRQQETVVTGDGLKGTQEEGNGGQGATEIQRPPGGQQGWYELQGQAMNSELDPSRGAFHEIES